MTIFRSERVTQTAGNNPEDIHLTGESFTNRPSSLTAHEISAVHILGRRNERPVIITTENLGEVPPLEIRQGELKRGGLYIEVHQRNGSAALYRSVDAQLKRNWENNAGILLITYEFDFHRLDTRLTDHLPEVLDNLHRFGHTIITVCQGSHCTRSRHELCALAALSHFCEGSDPHNRSDRTCSRVD